MERHEVELEHEEHGEEEEYEREFRGDHEAAVETLRAVVDGVADGSVELTDGPTVEVPTDRAFEVEVEYEREGGEHELELELEWHVPEEYGEGREHGEAGDDGREADERDSEGGGAQDVTERSSHGGADPEHDDEE